MPNLHKNPILYLTVPLFFIAEIVAALKLAKRLKPKLINAHWVIPQGITAFIVKKLMGIPYMVTVHGGDVYGLQNPLLIYVKKIIFQNAKYIAVVSHDIGKRIHKTIDATLKIDVISMGVDSKLFNPNKYDESIKKKYCITGPFLLFVGRLVENKGVKYLIEAMPAILKKKPTTKLMIIGSGPERDNLLLLTGKLNVQRSVIFLGAQPYMELPKYYATADIFIGPSIQTKGGDAEGFGLTFVEAIMSGCKAIGTNIGGISDIVESKNLIKPQDPKSISSKVIELLRKKNQLSKEFVNKYDYLNITKQHAFIYKNNI